MVKKVHHPLPPCAPPPVFCQCESSVLPPSPPEGPCCCIMDWRRLVEAPPQRGVAALLAVAAVVPNNSSGAPNATAAPEPERRGFSVGDLPEWITPVLPGRGSLGARRLFAAESRLASFVIDGIEKGFGVAQKL